jgi:hypothetical protein
MQLSQPKHIISLHTSAKIVSVEISTWSATKRDKTISDEVTTSKRASAGAGDFTKKLMAGNVTHKALCNYRQTVTNWLQRFTYDWHGKHKILPGVCVPKFMQEYAVHETAFNALKAKFLAEYRSIISNMAFELGDMFDPSNYPTLAQVDAKFSMRYLMTDVPQNDFRVNIASELADDLHKHYELQTQRIVDDAMSKAANRLLTFAERISSSCEEVHNEVLDDGTVKKARKRKIVEGTFDQAKELCAVLKDFNLTGNPDLEAARAALELTLGGFTTDDLRERATARKAVKEEVDEILSQFGALRTRRDDEEEDEE